MTEDFERKAEDALGAAVRAAEMEALTVMADRLGKLSPDDSLADALANAPADLTRMERAMERGADSTADAAEAAVASLMDDTEEWAAPMLAAAGASLNPEPLAAILAQGGRDAADAVRARMSTSALGLMDQQGRVLPFRDAYISIVSRAASDMAQGYASGYNATADAISEAVDAMADGGVRVMYASGRTRDVSAAVRQSVMGTFRKAMHDCRWEAGAQFGADGVEVSAHALCAPDHLPHQGRQMTMAQYEALNATLKRPLVDGANCRHVAFPVLLGVSAPAYSEDELEGLRERSLEKVTFNGLSGEPLTMTRYEATQYQRRLETSIRKAKMSAALKERAGVDASADKARARALQARYRAVSKEAGLITRSELARVRIPR